MDDETPIPIDAPPPVEAERDNQIVRLCTRQRAVIQRERRMKSLIDLN